MNEDKHMYGFAGDDTINTMGGKTEVHGGKGNDTINLYHGTTNEGEQIINNGATIYYNYTDYANNDGNDFIDHATALDTLNISTNNAKDLYMRYKNVGGALKIGFYSPETDTDDKVSTITVNGYFADGQSSEPNEDVLDTIIIDGVKYSLKNLIQQHGVMGAEGNFNKIIYTANEKHEVECTGEGPGIVYRNDLIFVPNNENDLTITAYGGDDVIYSGSGNDHINATMRYNDVIGNQELVEYGNGQGSKTIFAGAGDDTIYSGIIGQTEITGGKGDDTIHIQTCTDNLGIEAEYVESIDEETGLITVYVDADGNNTTEANHFGTKAVGYVVEDRRDKDQHDVIFYSLDRNASIDSVKINYDYSNGDGHDVIDMEYSPNYRREQQLDSLYINLGKTGATINNLRINQYDEEGHITSADLIIQFYKDGVRDEDNDITIKNYFDTPDRTKLKNVYINEGFGYVKSYMFENLLSEEGVDWTYNQDLYAHAQGTVTGGYGSDNIYVDEGSSAGINYVFAKGDNQIYGGNDTIYGVTNQNNINIFAGNYDLTTEYQIMGNNLEIDIKNGEQQVGSITLVDYYNQEVRDRIHCINIYKNSDNFVDIPEEFVNHVIEEPAIEDSDSVILNEGNISYTFEIENVEYEEGYPKTVQIVSEDSSAKTINISEFSLKDKNLNISYEPTTDEYGETVPSDNLSISAYDDFGNDEIEYSIRFMDYLNGDDKSYLNITDKYDTYSVVSANSTQSYNWSENNDNHVVFIQNNNGEASSITSNSKYNIINTNGGAGLDYTYGSGYDIIGTNSNASGDTYNISLTNKTAVDIYDAGGEDTLNITAANGISDARLLFDFNVTEDMFNGDELQEDYLMNGMTQTIFVMHKDSLNLETIVNAVSGSWANGVIAIEAKTNDEQEGFGIETVNINGTEVNTGSWAYSIAYDVACWLHTNEYGSVSEAFEKNDDISTLLAYYSNSQAPTIQS